MIPAHGLNQRNNPLENMEAGLAPFQHAIAQPNRLLQGIRQSTQHVLNIVDSIDRTIRIASTFVINYCKLYVINIGTDIVASALQARNPATFSTKTLLLLTSFALAGNNFLFSKLPVNIYTFSLSIINFYIHVSYTFKSDQEFKSQPYSKLLLPEKIAGALTFTFVFFSAFYRTQTQEIERIFNAKAKNLRNEYFKQTDALIVQHPKIKWRLNIKSEKSDIFCSELLNSLIQQISHSFSIEWQRKFLTAVLNVYSKSHQPILIRALEEQNIPTLHAKLLFIKQQAKEYLDALKTSLENLEYKDIEVIASEFYLEMLDPSSCPISLLEQKEIEQPVCIRGSKQVYEFKILKTCLIKSPINPLTTLPIEITDLVRINREPLKLHND